jgi:selenocysteine lyase/cysteine desulfurase
VVFVGPYEHHSNELPWRESIADVVEILLADDGRIDMDDLVVQLRAYADRPVKIGSFSAASNVTGLLTDADAVTDLLHEHGALAFWDYAAAGPYVDIRMSAGKDAVFLSPHKFMGGPQTPGVLVVRRDLVRNAVPTMPGGGTVEFVDPSGHQYVSDPVKREEGGTPAIVESIRAGLVFALKEAVGVPLIQHNENELWQRVAARWRQNPAVDILGDRVGGRLPIVSFRLKYGDRWLHHHFVAALLNDVFGVQSRGGCSCAGPYGHHLLGIDAAHSQEFQDVITSGYEGIKPGWIRLSFNYFISDSVADYLIEAVDLIATYGYRLLPDYRFDLRDGLWRHRDQPSVAVPDLGELWAAEPARPDVAGEESLAGQLAEARVLLAGRPADLADGVPELPAEFERIRWFPLPATCLS